MESYSLLESLNEKQGGDHPAARCTDHRYFCNAIPNLVFKTRSGPDTIGPLQIPPFETLLAMSSNSVWKTSHNVATTRRELDADGSYTATLKVATNSPLPGGELKLGEDSIALFGLQAGEEDESLIDLYVRGNDLVTRYRGKRGPCERELYWRVIDNATQDHDQDDSVEDAVVGLLAVELIYSLQTDLLDANPSPQVAVALPMKSFKAYSVAGASTDASRSWQISDDLSNSQLIIATLAGGAKIAIGAFPSDLAKLEIDNQQSPCPVVFHLDSDFLEKGVIRRTRMFACCGGSEVDDARLLQQAITFLNSEIPLTT